MFSLTGQKGYVKTLAVTAMLFIVAPGCAGTEKEYAAEAREEVRLMAATDLHYLSQSLYDPASESFLRLTETNDGKMFTESAAVLEALKQKTLEEKPDALLLAGDLTFNGERVSLDALARVFGEIEEAGIPVIVISGNHDICYPGAASFFGAEPSAAEPITPEVFSETMADYGFSEALYRDPDSLSYVAEIKEDVWLMTLDANMPGQRGTVGAKTLSWAENLLRQARDKDIAVIAMSHQNILIQNDLLYNGYVINNHDAVEHLLREYGVRLVLSGHSHFEHTAEKDGLTDICMESLAVYPLQYSIITLPADRSGFVYEKRKLGILEQESYDLFAETVVRTVKNIVENAADDPSEQASMTEFAAAVNAAFFSGDYAKIHTLADDTGRKLWQDKAGETSWGFYLESIFREAGEE